MEILYDNWKDLRRMQHGEKLEKTLDGLTKWLNIGQVTDVLNATRIKRHGKS